MLDALPIPNFEQLSLYAYKSTRSGQAKPPLHRSPTVRATEDCSTTKGASRQSASMASPFQYLPRISSYPLFADSTRPISYCAQAGFRIDSEIIRLCCSYIDTSLESAPLVFSESSLALYSRHSQERHDEHVNNQLAAVQVSIHHTKVRKVFKGRVTSTP